MGMQTEATVCWGFKLDSAEVLAMTKALKEQEEERVKQETEKQHEEEKAEDPTEDLESLLCDLVPDNLQWNITGDSDSTEQGVVIYAPDSSESVERWGYENYGCVATYLSLSKEKDPYKEDFEKVEELLLLKKAGVRPVRGWLLVLSIG